MFLSPLFTILMFASWIAIVVIATQLIVAFLISSKLVSETSKMKRFEALLSRFTLPIYDVVARFIKNEKLQIYVPVLALVGLYVIYLICAALR